MAQDRAIETTLGRRVTLSRGEIVCIYIVNLIRTLVNLRMRLRDCNIRNMYSQV